MNCEACGAAESTEINTKSDGYAKPPVEICGRCGATQRITAGGVVLIGRDPEKIEPLN